MESSNNFLESCDSSLLDQCIFDWFNGEGELSDLIEIDAINVGPSAKQENDTFNLQPCQPDLLPLSIHQHPASSRLPHILTEPSIQQKICDEAKIPAVSAKWTTFPGVNHQIKTLPDSPPDSGSEHAYSPPNIMKSIEGRHTSFKYDTQALNSLNVNQSQSVSVHPPLTDIWEESSIPSTSYVNVAQSPNYLPLCALNITKEDLEQLTQETPSNGVKKRKWSESVQCEGTINPLMELKSDPDSLNDDYWAVNSTDSYFKWTEYCPSSWVKLVDENNRRIQTPAFQVDADKGFNYSLSDESFVCQKKNHFQITVTLNMIGCPRYVKTSQAHYPEPIDSFHVRLHGIKMEIPSQVIRLEQSQSDRTKRPFSTQEFQLNGGKVSKVTIGRLHFSETTCNNMRKKGKPNPEQRYFQLVVSLQARCGNESHAVVAHVSEKIIVRASNPGQFENDADSMWQKGNNGIYHSGYVGINTDSAEEALTVHGNVKLTGQLMQPSDSRVKQNFNEVNSSEQLKNVAQMKIYKYSYTEPYMDQAGLPQGQASDTGVIAQEVREVLPDAVLDTGDVYLADGNCINNFLVVKKDRIFMENVGAVKELCKLTNKMECRIDELEQMNKKVIRLKKRDSVKSTTSGLSVLSVSTRSSYTSCTKHIGRQDHKLSNIPAKSPPSAPHISWCSSRFIQTIVILLILIMAFCLVSITVLYALEKQKDPIIVRHSVNSQSHHSVSHQPVPPSVTLPPVVVIHNHSITEHVQTPRHSFSKSPVKSTTESPRSVFINAPCDGVRCEPQCCINYQSDGSSPNLNEHNEASQRMLLSSINRTTLTTDADDESIAISRNEVRYSRVDDGYRNVINRKRRSPKFPGTVNIFLQPLNISLSDAGICLGKASCNLGNYSFDFELSNTFNISEEYTLEFLFNEGFVISMCAVKEKKMDCFRKPTEIKESPRLRPDFIPVNGKVKYDLPIARFTSETFRFRISSESSPCRLTTDKVGRIFIEYNLHFFRQPCNDGSLTNSNG